MLDRLTELFRAFPSIGPRQAKRFVYFLLSRDKSFLNELTHLILALKKDVAQCARCFRFFTDSDGKVKPVTSVCSICADTDRNNGELMVVVKDTDLEAMERGGAYHGTYFVLGGTMTLLPRKNGDKLRTKELRVCVDKGTKSGVLKEVILALSANPDGEYTSDELRRLLAEIPIKVSTLGRGLSTGSELEYADRETLKSALKNRSLV